LQEEVSLYTPQGYGPGLQRNFYDYHQPSLTKRPAGKLRPKSEILTGNRKVKEFLAPLQRPPQDRESSVDQSKLSVPQDDGKSTRMSRPRSRTEIERQPESSPQKMSRVQAAISAFNAKGQEADLQNRLNSKDLESEFEKLLVS
jgi:hypothetical protein